ncbi:hypothetical protein HOI26_04085 [Candidatus Woesearchaeota archaeon]|mgnify:CR=1 FL=1|nr:hypothetical protein [Candidatus Woesearchaeota archaeon]
MVVKKLKTGISGLDKVFKGGVREKSALLISGGPGTGKSIFAMHFLIAGAKAGEPGMAILYDVDKDEYLDYADTLGLPVRKYVDEKKIFLVKQPLLLRKTPNLSVPLELMRKRKIKRVVLDSLTMFSYVHVTDDRQYRSEIVNFLDRMNGVTLLATSEARFLNIDEANFNPEDFLFDGVVYLTKVRKEAEFERVLHVSKMRGQDHLINLVPFFIDKGGIKVYPDQIPFAVVGWEPPTTGFAK